jgi:ethanolamine utilization protein EutA (predicted chaperonin)
MLTLNIAQNVVDSAEIYAKYAQKSVSQLVEEYLVSISSENMINNKPLGPITKQLAGIIKLEKNINHKELLADTLLEKYL